MATNGFAPAKGHAQNSSIVPYTNPTQYYLNEIVSSTLAVPGWLVGVINGHKGRGLKLLMSASQTEICIDQQSSTSGTDGSFIIKICGRPEAVQYAEKCIYYKITECHKLEALDMPRYSNGNFESSVVGSMQPWRSNDQSGFSHKPMRFPSVQDTYFPSSLHPGQHEFPYAPGPFARHPHAPVMSAPTTPAPTTPAPTAPAPTAPANNPPAQDPVDLNSGSGVSLSKGKKEEPYYMTKRRCFQPSVGGDKGSTNMENFTSTFVETAFVYMSLCDHFDDAIKRNLQIKGVFLQIRQVVNFASDLNPSETLNEVMIRGNAFVQYQAQFNLYQLDPAVFWVEIEIPFIFMPHLIGINGKHVQDLSNKTQAMFITVPKHERLRIPQMDRKTNSEQCLLHIEGTFIAIQWGQRLIRGFLQKQYGFHKYKDVNSNEAEDKLVAENKSHSDVDDHADSPDISASARGKGSSSGRSGDSSHGRSGGSSRGRSGGSSRGRSGGPSRGRSRGSSRGRSGGSSSDHGKDSSKDPDNSKGSDKGRGSAGDRAKNRNFAGDSAKVKDSSDSIESKKGRDSAEEHAKATDSADCMEDPDNSKGSDKGRDSTDDCAKGRNSAEDSAKVKDSDNSIESEKGRNSAEDSAKVKDYANFIESEKGRDSAEEHAKATNSVACMEGPDNSKGSDKSRDSTDDCAKGTNSAEDSAEETGSAVSVEGPYKEKDSADSIESPYEGKDSADFIKGPSKGEDSAGERGKVKDSAESIGSSDKGRASNEGLYKNCTEGLHKGKSSTENYNKDNDFVNSEKDKDFAYDVGVADLPAADHAVTDDIPAVDVISSDCDQNKWEVFRKDWEKLPLKYKSMVVILNSEDKSGDNYRSNADGCNEISCTSGVHSNGSSHPFNSTDYVPDFQ